MCGLFSTNPSPWFQEDKFSLNAVCLRSFVEAYDDVGNDVSVYFILDKCGKEYTELIEKNVPFIYEKEYTDIGINGTMLKSYELASKEDGLVLFQECDYLYQPNIGKTMLQAIKELRLVSPYDHRNFYVDRNIHSRSCEIDLVSEYHFRTTERNTMTWGCHSDLVRECYNILMKYGYLDDKVWKDLWMSGYQLWVPLPSFATHCVKDYLSPGVDWEVILQKYL